MKKLTHSFVEFIPDRREDGIIYISVNYGVVSHNCCCGCGLEVVTPLSPTDWNLTFDGDTISLHPSIGNWAFSCKSHYWITNNHVHWAREFSSDEIAAVRNQGRSQKVGYYGDLRSQTHSKTETTGESAKLPKKQSIWKRLTKRFRRK